MEIALLSTTSVRLKGKNGSLIINPSGKVTGANGIILLENFDSYAMKNEEGIVIVRGPGEYELAGIKITGIRNTADTVYSIRIDKVEVLVGRISSFEKDIAKMNEHNILLLYADEVMDPSSLTSLATNVIIFFGNKAEETIQQLVKEGYRKETKFQTTSEKLPQEMEKILLQ